MQPTTISITPTEWEIMRIVWANGTLTGPQIIELSRALFDWKESTVKTLIGRLINKGHLAKDESVRPMLLSATLSELEANFYSIDHCVAQVCTRNRGQLISHLIANNELSQTEIQQLIQQLTIKQETAPDSVTCQCPRGQCSCHL